MHNDPDHELASNHPRPAPTDDKPAPRGATACSLLSVPRTTLRTTTTTRTERHKRAPHNPPPQTATANRTPSVPPRPAAARPQPYAVVAAPDAAFTASANRATPSSI